MKALRRNWGTQPYETYSKKKKKERIEGRSRQFYNSWRLQHLTFNNG